MLGLVLIAAGGTFLLSVLCTLVVRGWARRAQFVDRPGGHKQHAAPVALGGGVALVISILGPLVAGSGIAWILHHNGTNPAWLPSLLRIHLDGIASKFPSIFGIAICAMILHIMGLRDDRRPLGFIPKLVVQFMVAALIAGPLGIRAIKAVPAPLSFAITVFWIVLITNAFNFLDNMDGLSAGVAAIACGVFAVASAAGGQVFVPVMAWVGVGAFLGFLVFNFPPATIFMGDAGSLVIGFFLSVLTILTTYYDAAKDPTPLGVIVPLVVLAVPLYDVTSVVIHRLRAGQSPFRGDRRHFSHRLVTRGMSVRGAVLTIYLATAATALPAIILPGLNWAG
ncbi:MAG: MraY family glycosyltransferase, partial [Phycisphaerales bacterium]|nr:MraY family glycosyltransferase [Phycisphaerales bacterium]